LPNSSVKNAARGQLGQIPIAEGLIGFPDKVDQTSGLSLVRVEQLEYVAAVARTGSFRQAAEELQISQPALSQAVRNLERELGADVLERGRSGARVSSAGRELLPRILTVLDSVDQLRQAADTEHRSRRIVRVGTVNAATASLLAPAVREFREEHSATEVEVISGRHDEIQRSIREGRCDLGLVNYLDGDDQAADLDTVELMRGRVVVCVRPDGPLAARAKISVADLQAEPLITMRPGYVMHRYVHRLLDEYAISVSYSTDGAEMGKLMVASGLGATLLPVFSIAGDPLEQRGLITWRTLEDDATEVQLALERNPSGSPPRAARDLREIFVRRAQAYGAAPPLITPPPV
jgi:DNA-binding transcriptional LysR family regulator